MISVEDGADFFALARGRRSIPRVLDTPVPRETIERVLQAGAWAPNHYRTEPWRFVVVTGRSRDELGKVMASSLRSRLPAELEADGHAAVERERKKPLRAPVIVVLAAVPSDLAKVREIEEIEATAAAGQNMLLAAHALGLGAMWRTGQPAYDPAVKEFLGLPSHAHIVAFLYLGFPDLVDLPVRHRDARRVTTWLGQSE